MAAAIDSGIPVAVIRGGTSRGVYFRAEDLPSEEALRTAAILRAFGREGSSLADGLGGENPVLRKVAIVGCGPTSGAPETEVRYTFGQVDAQLTALSHEAECGNVAAGVPLFASLSGWVSRPAVGVVVPIRFVNTNRRVVGEWLDVNGAGGTIRLGFVDPVPPSRAATLPLGDPLTVFDVGPRGGIACTVLHAMNTYVFVHAPDLGVSDPAGTATLDRRTWELLEGITRQVAQRLPDRPVLKTCLIASLPERADVVSAHTVYVGERRSHPALAATGAASLIACLSLEGSVLSRPLSPGSSATVTVRHPSGTLDVRWSAGPSGLPDRVSIDRTCRLILRGVLY